MRTVAAKQGAPSSYSAVDGVHLACIVVVAPEETPDSVGMPGWRHVCPCLQGTPVARQEVS
jgi:hypothetical protein